LSCIAYREEEKAKSNRRKRNFTNRRRRKKIVKLKKKRRIGKLNQKILSKRRKNDRDPLLAGKNCARFIAVFSL